MRETTIPHSSQRERAPKIADKPKAERARIVKEGRLSFWLTDSLFNPEDIKYLNELPEVLESLTQNSTDDNNEAAKYPFYKLEPSVEHLKPLARYAPMIEDLRSSYLPPENRETEEALTPEALKKTSLSEEERFAWMCGDYLLREIAVRIAKGDMEGLKTIADAVAEYQMICQQRRAAENVAVIWTMVACDKLWKDGRNRDQVTKAEIKAEAMSLMSRAKRSSGSVKWQHVWDKLSLRDIKNAAPGRPKNR